MRPETFPAPTYDPTGTAAAAIAAHVAAGDPHTQYALESALGTMAAQAASAVSISGGSITGITDLAVADGGTGAGTPAAAASNLGLGTGDSPQFTGVNVGHASDTTITRTGAGDIAVEGNAIYRAGGTDVPITDGGTGASTALAARQALDVPGIIVAQRVSNTVTGAGFQNCLTASIPGGTLGTTDGVRFDALFRRTTGSGNLTFRVGYGGTVMVTFSASTNATTRVSGILFADGATNAQRVHATESRVTASPVTGTAAVDSTANQNLTIDVDFATDADVVTCDWFSVESLKP